MSAEKKLEERILRVIDQYYRESDKKMRKDVVMRSMCVRNKTDHIMNKLVNFLNGPFW